MRHAEFKRYYPITDARAEEKDGAMRIGGYAAVFNVRSEPIAGLFREIIKPGAFTKTLQEADVLAFWNHNTDIPLGRRSNGSLALSEDAHGLKFDLTLPNTSLARDAFELVRSGIVKEMSFGFRVPKGKDRWTHGADGMDEREVFEAQLFEVSPVAFPAYPATEAEARSIWDERSERTTSEPGTNANHSEAGPDWRIQIAKQRLRLMEMEA